MDVGRVAACMVKPAESKVEEAQDAGYFQRLKKQYELLSKAINDAGNATDDAEVFLGGVVDEVRAISQP
ncbi:Oidioi.mRNA.OKI2018_I69.chr2.g5021.t1.cds [Oikopleura dioica]|uniref:Oidioi.mRNA.OKI2018_I69.chr2.g5021.t1.cds n=1 Tax=Oikopleura dioica TaxID=34765 RepID=A0ABN7T5T4_OIKDI|nr:Oidioi.mRNA.OKI2018_I69.chr2.g5021.t1.cds [Oikopleura dioica]